MSTQGCPGARVNNGSGTLPHVRGTTDEFFDYCAGCGFPGLPHPPFRRTRNDTKNADQTSRSSQKKSQTQRHKSGNESYTNSCPHLIRPEAAAGWHPSGCHVNPGRPAPASGRSGGNPAATTPHRRNCGRMGRCTCHTFPFCGALGDAFVMTC